MSNINIEGIKSIEYLYNYERKSFNNQEAKFLLKINFARSFNTTPTLSLSFNKNISDGQYFCKFDYYPSILQIRLRSYQKFSAEQEVIIQNAVETQQQVNEMSTASKNVGSMMPGGAAVRSSVQLSFNIYLHYTFFDKPQFFSMMQTESITANQFFE